jgi:hypothetical protein
MSAVGDYFFNIVTVTLHTRRPFLHPQPEEAPSCGHSDPLMRIPTLLAIFTGVLESILCKSLKKKVFLIYVA